MIQNLELPDFLIKVVFCQSWSGWDQSDLANCQTKYWSASWRTPNGLFGVPLELCVTVKLWIGFWMFDVCFVGETWSATSSNLLIGWGSKYWNMLDHMQVAKQQLHLWNHERQSACANRRRMHWIHLTHLLTGRLCCSTFSTTFWLCHMLSHMRLVFFSCWLVTVVNDRCDPWNQLMKSALWCTTNGEVHPLQIQG